MFDLDLKVKLEVNFKVKFKVTPSLVLRATESTTPPPLSAVPAEENYFRLDLKPL